MTARLATYARWATLVGSCTAALRRLGWYGRCAILAAAVLGACAGVLASVITG